MINFKALLDKVIFGIGKVHWKEKAEIQTIDKEKIKELLTKDYYIILTRRDNHLSTYFINFVDFLLSFKWGYWSHALMNLEDAVENIESFRLIEATGTGVHYSPFDSVFDVQSVVLMKPVSMTIDEWTSVLDRAKAQLGKPYDTLFNIADDRALSCVELVRYILQGEPDYYKDFANFEQMIIENKNLSPQMIYDCSDFHVVYTAKI